MNKMLKQVHPYSVYYSESDMRWHTYIPDNTQLSGRKPIARKKKSELEKYLLKHYQLQLNTLKIYTFENLYVEFMQYKDHPAIVPKNFSNFQPCGSAAHSQQ